MGTSLLSVVGNVYGKGCRAEGVRCVKSIWRKGSKDVFEYSWI